MGVTEVEVYFGGAETACATGDSVGAAGGAVAGGGDDGGVAKASDFFGLFGIAGAVGSHTTRLLTAYILQLVFCLLTQRSSARITGSRDSFGSEGVSPQVETH